LIELDIDHRAASQCVSVWAAAGFRARCVLW